MAKGKKITREIFEKIKILLDAGVNPKKIMKLEGVSEETIRRVRHAETYEEYQENNRIEHIKFAKKILENGTDKQEQITFDELNRDDLLRELSQKIHDVADIIMDLVKGERT